MARTTHLPYGVLNLRPTARPSVRGAECYPILTSRSHFLSSRTADLTLLPFIKKKRKKIVLVWTIFKLFIGFVKILLPFYVLVFWP